MPTINETTQWKSLEQHLQTIKDTHLRTLLADESRCAALLAEHEGILLDLSRQRVDITTMDLLFDLANAAGLDQKRAAMAAGEHINVTEDRAVMHYALRLPKNFGRPVVVDGEDVLPAVHAVLDKIKDFSSRVRSGEWVGVTGKTITNVVSIGIGGSYLGPEFVFEALRTDPEGSTASAGRTLRFLANVDPADSARALAGLNPEETLVIVVSKTFTTAETMLNARTLKHWLLSSSSALSGHSAEEIVRKHMVAVSSAVPKAVQFGIDPENVFGFWDWVGGRYSVCSAVGVLPLSLQYGFEVVEQFLAGAHNMDKHFFEAPLRLNLPALLGVIGVWNSSFLGYSTRAILPYSQALTRFAAHIQQVDMESNGKRVALDGSVLPFECGEINFGEPGTNGQHSFYQLVHQGRVVPAEFIGFCESSHPIRLEGEAVSNHDELMSNFFAQPDALALGKTIAELEAEGVPPALHPHKEFPGNRPSLSLLFPRLTAYSCGQLLALYEHRVAVQGFIWGINSFDQWGVELGKVLATRVRNKLSAARSSSSSSGAEAESLDTSGLNPSTSTLLKAYLHRSAGAASP